MFEEGIERMRHKRVTELANAEAAMLATGPSTGREETLAAVAYWLDVKGRSTIEELHAARRLNKARRRAQGGEERAR